MSSSITINVSNRVESGLDLQKLKESNYMRDREYDNLLAITAGSLTQAYGNDAISVFRVAYQDLLPNDLQIEILDRFRAALIVIENMINPDRLRFTITKAMDDEICVNRPATNGGRVKLIVNDDGIIALSFIPNRESAYNDVLEFYNLNSVDFELLAYSFFKF
jgi:hypothetical protein